MPSNLVDAQETPNPNAMKFNLTRTIVEDGSRSYASPAEAADNELAAKLFQVEGVQMLFLLKNFVTVTKIPDYAWTSITPQIVDVLSDWAGKID